MPLPILFSYPTSALYLPALQNVSCIHKFAHLCFIFLPILCYTLGQCSPFIPLSQCIQPPPLLIYFYFNIDPYTPIALALACTPSHYVPPSCFTSTYPFDNTKFSTMYEPSTGLWSFPSPRYSMHHFLCCVNIQILVFQSQIMLDIYLHILHLLMHV